MSASPTDSELDLQYVKKGKHYNPIWLSIKKTQKENSK